MLAALGAGAAYMVTRRASAADARLRNAPWFAAYVDVTLTPTFEFQDPSANPVRGVFLGFIVSQPSSPCTPSWGGYYTLGQAEGALNLDERLAQVRAQGGQPVLSFGGAANTELAVACQSVPALTAAYLAPVTRYGASTIDLDLEGSSITGDAANQRRAQAIAAAQHQERAHGTPLGVWLTLPVTPAGLSTDGLATIRAFLAAHVGLIGVNVLAMDFGSRERDMITPVEQSLTASNGQLQSLGLARDERSAWARMGVTVMIGQNDVPGERFTLRDARELTAFAARRRLARVSMWSLNRDSACGTVFVQTGVLSNTCSGVPQAPLQFTRIFSRLAGTETASSPALQSAAAPSVQQAPPDNPATSPYPIWQPTAMYVAGYKVVWHRNIYQAKWFSQGAAPDAPVQSNAQAPWLLMGPVLAGARAPSPTLLDSAKHPAWSPVAVYHVGDRVSYRGLPFAAKWYTRGDTPETTLPADSRSPWQPLFTIPGEPGAS